MNNVSFFLVFIDIVLVCVCVAYLKESVHTNEREREVQSQSSLCVTEDERDSTRVQDPLDSTRYAYWDGRCGSWIAGS